ncbi:MAG TPA: metalloregulator ArsR/SmtB family transcription factor [Anaerolineae bacterium]|jgi:ArsR family transcriptional regulator
MEESKQLAKVFKVLMHPARLDILDILRDGEQCVCHMEAHLGYRQAYISQHLTVLRDAGLVEDRRDGWNIFYHACEPKVFQLIDQARAMQGVPARSARKSAQRVACPCPKCAAKKANPVPLQE